MTLAIVRIHPFLPIGFYCKAMTWVCLSISVYTGQMSLQQYGTGPNTCSFIAIKLATYSGSDSVCE